MEALMSKTRMVSTKISEEVYKELMLRVPEGDRSDFLRDAIMEKLQKTPKPDRILDLEKRFSKIETEVTDIRKYLADLELLTYGSGKQTPTHFASTI